MSKQVTQPQQSTQGAQVLSLPAPEASQKPLSAVDESVAIRLTYLDDSGSLQRATLSTSSRLRSICDNASKTQLLKTRLASALGLLGMKVIAIEPVGSVFIELL